MKQPEHFLSAIKNGILTASQVNGVVISEGSCAFETCSVIVIALVIVIILDIYVSCPEPLGGGQGINL